MLFQVSHFYLKIPNGTSWSTWLLILTLFMCCESYSRRWHFTFFFLRVHLWIDFFQRNWSDLHKRGQENCCCCSFWKSKQVPWAPGCHSYLPRGSVLLERAVLLKQLSTSGVVLALNIWPGRAAGRKQKSFINVLGVAYLTWLDFLNFKHACDLCHSWRSKVRVLQELVNNRIIGCLNQLKAIVWGARGGGREGNKK